MQLAEIPDYLRLRVLVENPLEVIRFRKKRRPGEEIVIRFRDGRRLRLRGDRQDFHIFRSVFLRDEYRLRPYSAAGWKCVIDLGANVGIFSARAAPLTERLIAYEPAEENTGRLEENLTGFSNVVSVRSAVSGNASSLRIYAPRAERGSGLYSQYVRDENDPDDFQVVPAVTLEDVFRDHDISRCDLLKIDVEGAEYEILYATSDEVLRSIDRIHGEYHNVEPENPGTRIGAFSSYLHGRGFDVEAIPFRKGENYGMFYAQRRGV